MHRQFSAFDKRKMTQSMQQCGQSTANIWQNALHVIFSILSKQTFQERKTNICRYISNKKNKMKMNGGERSSIYLSGMHLIFECLFIIYIMLFFVSIWCWGNWLLFCGAASAVAAETEDMPCIALESAGKPFRWARVLGWTEMYFDEWFGMIEDCLACDHRKNMIVSYSVVASGASLWLWL